MCAKSIEIPKENQYFLEVPSEMFKPLCKTNDSETMELISF